MGGKKGGDGEGVWTTRYITERGKILVLTILGQKGQSMFISKDSRKLASVFIYNFLWVMGRILLMHSEAKKVIKQEEEDSSSGYFCRLGMNFLTSRN